jgi:hypothetical protein
MAEYSLNSPEGKTWLPWFREIFDEGRDLPPERPAALMLTLASGKADVLSGCFIQPGRPRGSHRRRGRNREPEALHTPGQ